MGIKTGHKIDNMELYWHHIPRKGLVVVGIGEKSTKSPYVEAIECGGTKRYAKAAALRNLRKVVAMIKRLEDKDD